MSAPLRHFLALKGMEEPTLREILTLAARYKTERKNLTDGFFVEALEA